MYRRILLFSLIMCFLMSCTEKREILTTEQIYSKYSSGVVLILNKYFYSMTMENGLVFYFADLENDGTFKGLTFNPDKISLSYSTGTGFFVSSDGQIATNSHVAYPYLDEKMVLKYVHSTSGKLKELLYQNCQELQATILQMKRTLSQLEGSELRQMRKSIKEYEETLETVYASFKMFNDASLLQGTLECHAELSIAYNNTHVEKYSDMVDCIQYKDYHEKDLALIQLKNKQTPERCYIFNPEQPVLPNGEYMPDCNGKPIDVDNPPIGTHLHIIGYNKGFAIGKTEEGINSQLTEGKIEQLPSDLEIMYGAATLGGSSGSPVLNDYGDLIAIHHAGITMTQGFNYGVKVKHLRDLVNKKK